MGKGKGNVAYWVCNVKPGRILYEVVGSDLSLLKSALKIVSNKLPISVQVIERKLKD